MAGFVAAPTLIKVVVVLVILGFVLHLIGFATPYWISWDYSRHRSYYGGHSGHQGLWRGCSESRLYGGEICGSIGDSRGWFEAVQAFETLGFIAALAALILIVLYIFVPATSGKRIIFILTMIACFVAAGCIILGIIIYGTKMSNLSWSFALSTIGGVIFGVAAILLVVDMLKR